MTKAQRLFKEYSKETLPMQLEYLFENYEVEVNQLWDKEETHYTFDDWSTIVINNEDIYIR